jgi:amino acid adenylation domain-containing protein
MQTRAPSAPVAHGATRLPRWASAPVAGVAEHALPLPAETTRAVRATAEALGVTVDTLLLAAHGKVVAALTGESAVVVGLVTADADEAVPCLIELGDGTWRDLADAAAESALRAGAVAGPPPYDTVLDVSGGLVGDPPAGGMRIHWYDGVLRVTYRTDAFDAPHAARVAGYHATALRLLAADPTAGHRTASLLSDEELRFQLHELAGPERELPDRRFHELFEERVRERPDAIAAGCGDRLLTYAELNRRANRIGRALLARGAGREDVIGVVTERDLDWMAAVIAIFKAGCAYLPIEPRFPAERIAAMLSRSACRLVLTEEDSGASLDQALVDLPTVARADLRTCFEEDHPDGDLGVEVDAGQLAYIYFTSGSTGEPKGAMCEHAGMLNHLFAKIDDLGVRPGGVVAQTAPQCFDISLWQLVAGLVVGAQTLIVEQDVVLDVQAFVDTIVEHEVEVLQVVPSYLEVVLSHVAGRAIELPNLRCVSVTGEALRKELTEHWFARFPGIKLVNAYGLTETSDDTNHEVMEGVPEHGVPLGRPVHNVRVYVVDERLRPVPLGAPGEIVFSGVCVGRGYVNDEERTRTVFTSDPHRPGERLYRSGDFGRWSPEGKLEFLGRRDAQVKVNGFRIEIGEIENRLLRLPSVQEGAVIVKEGLGGGAQLLAFYAAPPSLPTRSIRAALGETLPEYMVPSRFYWLDTLPLTGNGKIDRKVLARLADDVAVEASADPPRTPAEHRLAAAWAEALGIGPDRVGRTDHFFDQGGTSLSAVRLVAALDRAVSLKDITRSPVLADLAEALDSGRGPDEACLQRLAGREHGPALVCFPYAGGNAVNYRAVADMLDGSAGLAVYAVEPPGDGLTRHGGAFADVVSLAGKVADEIERLGAPVTLWGHSSGVAPAIETARLLERRGHEVRHVFLAAQLLDGVPERRDMIEEVTRSSDAAIAERLRAERGEAGLEADAEAEAGLEAFVAAYRHDTTAANRYLIDLLGDPPADRLSAPVTVVVAADDPATDGHRDRYRDWELVAERVGHHALDGGGHYFVHSRPADVAALVTRSGGGT